MCLSFCLRTTRLYFNHEDCPSFMCEHASERHPPCQTCRHQQDRICALTRAPLPVAGGCCHWNIEPIKGLQVVSRSMIEMLGIGINERIQDVLVAFDAPFEIDGEAQIRLDPELLNVPETYGIGCDH